MKIGSKEKESSKAWIESTTASTRRVMMDNENVWKKETFTYFPYMET